MFSEPKRTVSKEQAKPSPIRPTAERIKDRTSIKKTFPGESQPAPFVKSPEKDSYKPTEPREVTKPPEPPRPDMKSLIEDIKNLIKLESWLMALQKANELIHYYPDSPETDKIRGSISFLVKKVQETKQR
jgi:hypothetical protein